MILEILEFYTHYDFCYFLASLRLHTYTVSFAFQSTWHCFTFEKTTSRDTSLISGRPRTPILTPSVVNYKLPAARGVHVSPIQVVIYFKAPVKQLERSKIF